MNSKDRAELELKLASKTKVCSKTPVSKHTRVNQSLPKDKQLVFYKNEFMDFDDHILKYPISADNSKELEKSTCAEVTMEPERDNQMVVELEELKKLKSDENKANESLKPKRNYS